MELGFVDTDPGGPGSQETAAARWVSSVVGISAVGGEVVAGITGRHAWAFAGTITTEIRPEDSTRPWLGKDTDEGPVS